MFIDVISNIMRNLIINFQVLIQPYTINKSLIIPSTTNHDSEAAFR